jgi:hypothetical protein
VECLNGKGTISTSPDFGGSVIPEAKDTGRSYKAINIMDARPDNCQGLPWDAIGLKNGVS